MSMIAITRHIPFHQRAEEEAYIHACELCGPNSSEFESVQEKLLDNLLIPVCGNCPHMECDRCTR